MPMTTTALILNTRPHHNGAAADSGSINWARISVLRISPGDGVTLAVVS